MQTMVGQTKQVDVKKHIMRDLPIGFAHRFAHRFAHTFAHRFAHRLAGWVGWWVGRKSEGSHA